MTVVPGSIHSRIVAVSVSAVLSGTGTRNVLPDRRSTPPNTHWPWQGDLCCTLADRSYCLNFDGLIRTTEFFRVALQELEHGFKTGHAPVSDRMVTEAKLFFDLVGWFAAQDVVRNKYNFYESEITQLEPWSVPDGRRPTVPDPSNSLSTSPPKSFCTMGVCGPRHISLQMLHCTLLRIRPTSLRNWIASSWWPKRYVRKSCSFHRLSVPSHVRRKTSAMTASSANDPRTPQQLASYAEPFSSPKKTQERYT